MGDVRLVLELKTFMASTEIVTEPLRKAGYRFFTLAQTPDDEATRRKLYTLVREGVTDTTGFSGEFETYKAFAERIYALSYRQCAESQFLAAYGDEWVGLSSFVLENAEQGKFGLTAVTRPHRGVGLARALKSLALRYAHALGVQTVVTENHPDNVAIRELNKTLGFR